MGDLYYYVKEDLSTARFSERDEIIGRCQKAVLSLKKVSSASGIPIIPDLSKGIVYTDNTDTNSLIVSSTGTGKTRRSLIPELITIACEGKSSVICHDPKGELFLHTSKLYKKKGYRIRVLNFRNCMQGNCYNPLKMMAELYCAGNQSKAIELFQAFANTMFATVQSQKDPFWHQSAASYMVGLFLILCQIYKDDPKMISLYTLYDLHIKGNKKYGTSTFLKEYCNMKTVDELAYKFLAPALDTASDTRGGIYSVFTTVLSSYVNNSDVVDMISSCDFTPEDFINEPTILYIISRDESRIYDNLIASIIDQFYGIFIDIANDHKGVLPRRVELILDEFSNMSRINDIDRKISASRSRNIRWTLCIQSLQQLDIVYGKETARVIISNCNNIIYFYSPDLELLLYLSKRCGTRKNMYTGQMEDLMPVERLQNLNNGECLVILGKLNPFVTNLPDISEYPLVEMADLKMKERKRKTQETKDIVEIVRMYKQQEAMKKMEGSEGEEIIIPHRPIQPSDNPIDEESIDYLIEKLDENIKQLEAIENNEFFEKIGNKETIINKDEFLSEEDFE